MSEWRVHVASELASHVITKPCSGLLELWRLQRYVIERLYGVLDKSFGTKELTDVNGTACENK